MHSFQRRLLRTPIIIKGVTCCLQSRFNLNSHLRHHTVISSTIMGLNHISVKRVINSFQRRLLRTPIIIKGVTCCFQSRFNLNSHLRHHTVISSSIMEFNHISVKCVINSFQRRLLWTTIIIKCDMLFIKQIQSKQPSSSPYCHHFIHNGVQPYQCKACDINSFQRRLLWTTIIIKCDMLFIKQIQSKQPSSSPYCHLFIHNGVQPYQCKACDKQFPEKTTLNNHHYKVWHAVYKEDSI